MNSAAALRSDAFAYPAGESGPSPIVLNALRRRAYRTAYEPGCAAGALTERLAAVASRVIAIDCAPEAVGQAQLRCAGLKNVDVLCADLTHYFPTTPLDLIVFSEVGYYFSESKLAQLAASLADCLMPGGEFIAVHGLGSAPGQVLHGSRVHEILAATLPLRRLKSASHPGFRLDSWIEA